MSINLIPGTTVGGIANAGVSVDIRNSSGIIGSIYLPSNNSCQGSCILPTSISGTDSYTFIYNSHGNGNAVFTNIAASIVELR
jgi:hypothetical protein